MHMQPQRRVNGYAPPPWNQLASFPRDGRTVEVIDSNGDVYLAKWQNGTLMVDAEEMVELTHWRSV